MDFSTTLDQYFSRIDVLTPSGGDNLSGYYVNIELLVQQKNYFVRTIKLMCRAAQIGEGRLVSHSFAQENSETREDPQIRRFALCASMLGLLEKFELELVAICEPFSAPGQHITIPVCTIRGARLYEASGYSPKIPPLLVQGHGRSGTTYLMQLLGRHPQLLTLPLFPYENRPAVYWMHMAQVLTSPGDPNNSVPRAIDTHQRYWTGRNPFNDEYFFQPLPEDGHVKCWFADEHVADTVAFAQRRIDDYYAMLGRDLDKPDASFFVEKCPPANFIGLFREFYETIHEVYLIRDPRDIVCSVRSFFDDNEFYKSDTYITSLKIGMEGLLESWSARKDKVLLVRYEELVSDPARELERVLRLLGTDVSPSEMEVILSGSPDDDTTRQKHVTGESPFRSIGRWRRDLSEPDKKLCNNVFEPLLRTLGYE